MRRSIAASTAHSEEQVQYSVDKLSKDSRIQFKYQFEKDQNTGLSCQVPPMPSSSSTKLLTSGSPWIQFAQLNKISRRTGPVSFTFARISKRFWKNRKLASNANIAVYQVCVLRTLLYSSVTWKH